MQEYEERQRRLQEELEEKMQLIRQELKENRIQLVDYNRQLGLVRAPSPCRSALSSSRLMMCEILQDSLQVENHNPDQDYACVCKILCRLYFQGHGLDSRMPRSQNPSHSDVSKLLSCPNLQEASLICRMTMI